MINNKSNKLVDYEWLYKRAGPQLAAAVPGVVVDRGDNIFMRHRSLDTRNHYFD